MRTFFCILFISLSLSFIAQNNTAKNLMDSAKVLFKSTHEMTQTEIDQFDYYRVVSLLEQVIALEPENSEAIYYLGYTYSRINSRDGRSMIDMNLPLVLKTSEAFERVNKISPKYEGEIIILDPYSKISSEWGSLAMSYWHNHKPDSARWAFKEGRNRGGFGDYILSLNRKVLDTCAKNAIVISSGDNSTIPLWYLQIVENYRPDVTIVDVSLLNTIWYPDLLAANKQVGFDLPKAVLDTIEYLGWHDSTITISGFSWTVKPSYYEHYILRGDRVFLSLLKANGFKRDIYFTIGFPEDSRLNLGKYTSNLVLADRLTTNGISQRSFEQYKKSVTDIFALNSNINVNSSDELTYLDFFRYDVLEQIQQLIQNKEKNKAKELLLLMDKMAPEYKFPFQNPQGKESVDALREQL